MIIILIKKYLFFKNIFWFFNKIVFVCVLQDIRPYIKPTTPEIISTTANNLSLPKSSNPSPNVWPKNNAKNSTPPSKSKLQFTMKREYDRAREEAELVKQLRNASVSYINLFVFIVFHRLNNDYCVVDYWIAPKNVSPKWTFASP